MNLYGANLETLRHPCCSRRRELLVIGPERDDAPSRALNTCDGQLGGCVIAPYARGETTICRTPPLGKTAAILVLVAGSPLA
jgi:hypothetical protein